MISLYSEPNGNDFERGEDNRASQCKDEVYDQSGHREVFPGGKARLRKLGEEQPSDGPQSENDICNMRDLRRKEAGR